MVFQMNEWRFEQVEGRYEDALRFEVLGHNAHIDVCFELDHTPFVVYTKTPIFDIPIEILHAFLAGIRKKYPKGIEL